MEFDTDIDALQMLPAEQLAETPDLGRTFTCHRTWPTFAAEQE